MTLVFVFFLLIVSSLPIEAEGSGTGDFPPPKDGDWDITVDTVVENETIVLNGNLTVYDGASLTFRNVTLVMNSSAGGSTVEDFYHIEVQRGGTMRILDQDGDNNTIDDSSNITLKNTSSYYWFRVRNGSNFTMKNSELHNCGGGPVSYGAGGLTLYNDNSTLDRNFISNNENGVVCWNSDAMISNNTIVDNEVAGVYARTWSNGTIENNWIVGNNDYGVWVDGGSNSNPRPSFPLVKGNYIENSFVGMQINIYSIPDIRNNLILDSDEDGIYCGQWCEVTIRNTTIDGGNYGIASSSARNVTIINCTVKNIGPWYDLSMGSVTYFTTINTTFNKSNVGFLNTNANLTVKWYMHPRVEDADTGSDISGADVRIRDNVNGTYDENFTTKSQGYVRWVPVTEYYQTDNNGDDDGNDSGEKILYTPYLVNASAPGYYDGSNETGMGGSKVVLIKLTAVPEFSVLIIPVLFVLLINISKRFL